MASDQYSDPNPTYWAGYSNLQQVKHGLIRAYLNGWFPILGSWAGRILYVDTHAGRGRHAQGALGSPLVALSTFLNHRMRDTVLTRCEVRFVFFEKDPANLQALDSELDALGPLPDHVAVDRYATDFEGVMREALATLRASRVSMAPAFIFVDPYGFKLPYQLLADFMAFDAVEIFVNVMWRHLDMALAQARTVPGKAQLVDHIFGREDWRQIGDLEDHGQRCEQIVSLIKRIVNAKWATSVRMLGLNDVTEYVLLHLTNHDAGRDLMKRALWRECPSFGGRFVARKSDDLAQMVLLSPEPDLSALEGMIVSALRRQPLRWRALHHMVRGEIWLDSHVNQVVIRLLKEKRVVPSDYEGKCSATSNPVLSLAQS